MFSRNFTSKSFNGFKSFFILAVLFISANSLKAQFLAAPSTNVSQVCQCDTITVSFVVTPDFYTAGNTMRVELSNQSSVFNGFFIETAPLSYQTPHGVTGSIDAVVPCTLSQGGYRVRVIASNPSDTSAASALLIVGKKPNVTLALNGGFAAQNSFGFNQYFFCEDDSVEISVVGHESGNTYQWLRDGIAQGPSGTAQSIWIKETGVYQVNATQGFCQFTSKDTLLIEYAPTPIIDKTNSSPGLKFGPDTLFFCIGDTVILRSFGPFGNASVNTGLPNSYQWITDSLDAVGNTVIYPMPGDTFQDLRITEPGIYWMRYGDGQCIDTSRAFYVFMDTIPATPVLLPNGLTTIDICEGDSVLAAAFFAVPEWDYQWQISFPVGSPFVNIPGAIDADIMLNSDLVPPGVNLDTVQIRLITSNTTCVFVSDTLNVNIVPFPEITFNIPNKTFQLCEGDSVLVIANSNFSNSLFQWQVQPNPINLPQLNIRQPGTYIIRVTNPTGCATFDTIRAIADNPNVSAGPDQTVLEFTTVQLNAIGGLFYRWTTDQPALIFNDNQLPNPRVQVGEAPDTITCYVAVEGETGCITVDSMRIFVIKPDPAEEEIYTSVSNFISPNGDGINDNLDLTQIMAGNTCELVVMNRWGRTVYNSIPYTNNWEGQDNGGVALPDGVYIIILQCNDEVTYKGSVTIIRNTN